jgi:hypothetical protein
MPCSFKGRLIVVLPIIYPTLLSAPRSRVYPHRGFSVAILMSSLAISAGFRGRPGPRVLLPSYFFATSSRYVPRIVPLGERHLRRAVSEFADHYHRERNHQGLENRLIEDPPEPANLNGRVVRVERLGGLLNFYHREAA